MCYNYVMRKYILLALVFCLFITGIPSVNAATIPIYIRGKQVVPDTPPILQNNRTFVPIRYIAESFGAKVNWNEQLQQVTIDSGNTHIVLRIGDTNISRNGNNMQLDVAPFIRNDRTYVPLRFVSEALGHYVDWDATEQAVYIDTDAVYRKQTITVGSKKITANVVKVFVGNPHVDLTMAYGQNKIGLTESLASMANRNNAIAAINGTFFRAYETTNPKEPSGNLIIDGRIEHLCFRDKPATTFGFTWDNKVDIGSISMMLSGKYLQVQNPEYAWLHSWYVGTINRSMTYWNNNSINIYTSKRGPTTRAGVAGTNVIVQDSKIVGVVEGSNFTIPKDGYVVWIGGSEKRYLDRFTVGDKITYEDLYFVQQGNADIWKQGVIEGGLSAGPRLVTNGIITVNPEAENYTIPKITQYSTPRSAIGITKDGKLLLVTVPSAAIKELAVVMQKLGAYNAMNVDGGASSGLYYKGQMITTPGRDLSNALIVTTK